LEYPNTTVDDKREQLTGARRYVFHFRCGQTAGRHLLEHVDVRKQYALRRERLRPLQHRQLTTDGLKMDADGSLTVVIQKEPATSNWLPAPEGPFNLTLRLMGRRRRYSTVRTGFPP